MKESSDIRWIRISYSAPSFLSVIQDDTFKQLNVGKMTWKALLSNPSLQDACSEEGFNLKALGGRLKMRLGIFTDDSQSCGGPDSYLGFGTELTGTVCGKLSTSSSCGNVNGCTSTDTKAFGIILVR